MPGTALPLGYLLLLAAPAIGSWLGVLIRRWPKGAPMVLGRSACEHCGRQLGTADLIPLLSFAWLRGRCRYCGSAIGWFHPGVEIAAFAVAALAVVADGSGWTLVAHTALGWALLCAVWIDAETLLLPDAITLPLVLAGLAFTSLQNPDALYDHAAAAALGYIGFRLLDELYALVRHRHGLGEGDAKLLAGAGAWLGLAALPSVILAAGLAGLLGALLLIRHGRSSAAPLPFGPALALGFFAICLMQR